MSQHPIVKLVKDMIREPYAWPGGYTKVLTMEDGEHLCHTCTRKNFKLICAATRQNMRDGWQAAGVDAYWEGPPTHCANCNTVINSEYGDPEAA